MKCEYIEETTSIKKHQYNSSPSTSMKVNLTRKVRSKVEIHARVLLALGLGTSREST